MDREEVLKYINIPVRITFIKTRNKLEGILKYTKFMNMDDFYIITKDGKHIGVNIKDIKNIKVK